MSKTTVRPMIEVALLATIAYILDLVTQPMSLGPWISLSFKMVPIFLLSFRWGVKAGAMGGFIWGLLQVVTGEAAGGWLTPIQGFLEYFVGRRAPAGRKATTAGTWIRTSSAWCRTVTGRLSGGERFRRHCAQFLHRRYLCGIPLFCKSDDYAPTESGGILLCALDTVAT